MDPLHRSNGIPSVKYKYKKIVRASVSSIPRPPAHAQIQRGGESRPHLEKICNIQLFQKPLTFTVLSALNFVKIKALRYHGALSIINTFVNFKGPLNHAIVSYPNGVQASLKSKIISAP